MPLSYTIEVASCYQAVGCNSSIASIKTEDVLTLIFPVGCVSGCYVVYRGAHPH